MDCKNTVFQHLLNSNIPWAQRDRVQVQRQTHSPHHIEAGRTASSSRAGSFGSAFSAPCFAADAPRSSSAGADGCAGADGGAGAALCAAAGGVEAPDSDEGERVVPLMKKPLSLQVVSSGDRLLSSSPAAAFAAASAAGAAPGASPGCGRGPKSAAQAGRVPAAASFEQWRSTSATFFRHSDGTKAFTIHLGKNGILGSTAAITTTEAPPSGCSVISTTVT
mmetsp:Transcript_45416/g.145725  ORF Transcript_45416/g.145725 Transcript_45416/m.145725 type:complete len:221 (+) Transcript_45416:193-855(+)